MNTKKIWNEIRYSLFLVFAFAICTMGFYIGTLELPFDKYMYGATTPIPLFTLSIALVIMYTFLYNLYYEESGIVTFLISFICMAYPFVEFRYGIILLTLQSSLVLLAYGIGLNIGSGISLALTIYNREESPREVVTREFRNMFKG